MPRAFAMGELLATMLCIVLLISVLTPALARVNESSGVQASLSNLQRLHTAFMQYAADWQDRQPTIIADNLAQYGSTLDFAFGGYSQANGPHPAARLGFNCSSINHFVINPGPHYPPLHFPVSLGVGAFRGTNLQLISDYLDGRFFNPTFFAPMDRSVWPVVEPWLEHDCEWVHGAVPNSTLLWSSYCRSAAAMFHPDVMRSNANGGFRNPFGTVGFPHGFRSPTFSQALYPHLKTHLLEHNWNQDTPANVCNPLNSGTDANAGCDGYRFNAGMASSPAALFYDGSVRLLPNSEAVAADAHHRQQTNNVDGLWHRGTPLGAAGYFGGVGSHHILTTDGIRGRDTLPGFGPPRLK